MKKSQKQNISSSLCAVLNGDKTEWKELLSTSLKQTFGEVLLDKYESEWAKLMGQCFARTTKDNLIRNWLPSKFSKHSELIVKSRNINFRIFSWIRKKFHSGSGVCFDVWFKFSFEMLGRWRFLWITDTLRMNLVNECPMRQILWVQVLFRRNNHLISGIKRLDWQMSDNSDVSHRK